MSDEPKVPPPERHGGFFNLERDARRVEMVRPDSLLRTTEWGGLTVVSLLLSWAFPPYFISVMVLAFLNAGGLLWVTHLGEVGRRRLREFETDFAVGHALEEAGNLRAATEHYEALIPHYSDVPKIAEIAARRAVHLKAIKPKRASKPKTRKSGGKARR